jgi:tetratricopeptide (TPR) repeat protein
MKKIFSILSLLLFFDIMQAQSVDEGYRYLYYERNHSAEKTFLQIINQNPANTKAWLGLSSAYMQEMSTADSAHRLPIAPQSIIGDPYYLTAYGTILLQRNNPDAANYFKEALSKTREKDAVILAAIAEAHINAKNGDPNYAIELLRKAIKRDKHDPALYVLLGDAERKRLNGSEAFKAYSKAIDQNEKYAAAYHRIGKIFLTQKNPGMYVDYFKKAIAADSNYAPAFYELYFYEFNLHPQKALEYYKSYVKKSDHTIENEYDLADLLYLDKQFDAAIGRAKAIIQSEGENVEARMYKMIAYSYAAKMDTSNAIEFMKQYFGHQEDSGLIAKDYLSMAQFYSAEDGEDSVASVYLEKAVALETDSTKLLGYYKDLSELAKKRKNYEQQAQWLGKYYNNNAQATNVDLFNWGLANYSSENYLMADSIFGMYTNKYPEQSFGYYWQAKSRALQDTAMETGLAVPVYKKLIEVMQTDTTASTYKRWMVEAYGYLAAYAANNQKDYQQAIDYFEKVLEVDPGNESARKYIAILEKDISKIGSR